MPIVPRRWRNRPIADTTEDRREGTLIFRSRPDRGANHPAAQPDTAKDRRAERHRSLHAQYRRRQDSRRSEDQATRVRRSFAAAVVLPVTLWACSVPSSPTPCGGQPATTADRLQVPTAWHSTVDGPPERCLARGCRCYTAEGVDRLAPWRGVGPAIVGGRSVATNCTTDRYHGASLRALSEAACAVIDSNPGSAI
jgi:hypothetical protein